MSVTIETLEGRTLFSGGNISQVTADYELVVGDAAALKASVAVAATEYKASVKEIAADIKALPKSKTNTADEAKLSKASTAAGALDTRDVAKIISVGKADLNKAKAAFLAVVKKPTAASSAKLDAALAVLNSALAGPEAKLFADAGAGQTVVSADLAVLGAANPTDTQLSTDVSAAESNQASASSTINAEVATTNADVTTLVTDIQ